MQKNGITEAENIVYQAESEWKGCRQLNFFFEGRPSLLVVPRHPAAGRPWVWRTEFFGSFDSVDTALLERGWFLAYHKLSDMFGCPESVLLMRRFQAAAEKEFGLAPKAVLFGFSRGGLYTCNYALQYPEKTVLMYLDAPVLDIRSWPGGKGIGLGSPKEWENCLRVYGLTEETAPAFHQNPLDKAEELTALRLPLLLIAGEADQAVPYTENGAVLAEKYAAAGGVIQTIVKPGCDHHPHSLEDPAPAVEFILEHAKG